MRVHKERQVEYVPSGGCSEKEARKVAVVGGGGEGGERGGGTALNEAIRNI